MQLLGAECGARHADDIHDLLLRLGDLSAEELRLRCQNAEVFAQVEALLQSRRVLLLMVVGRAALCSPWSTLRSTAMPSVPCCPEDLAGTWLEAGSGTAAGIAEPLCAHPWIQFTLDDLWRRYQIPNAVTENALADLVRREDFSKAVFAPAVCIVSGCIRRCCSNSAAGRWRDCAARSEPLEARVLGVFLPRWQGVGSKRGGWIARGLLERCD